MELDFERALPQLKNSNRAALTPKEAALLFGVSEEHIMALIEEGTLGAIDVAGRYASRRCWRLSTLGLIAFAQARSNANVCDAIPANSSAPAGLGGSKTPPSAGSGLATGCNAVCKGTGRKSR